MNRISRVFFFLFVSDWNFIIFQRSLFGVYSAECTSKLKVNFPWNKVNQTAILTCNNIYQIYNIEFRTEKNLKRKALCEIQMKRSVRLKYGLNIFRWTFYLYPFASIPRKKLYCLRYYVRICDHFIWGRLK